MTPRQKWTLAIIGLLAGNILAMAILTIVATGSRSQVIPHYYEQATHYDARIDEAAAARALGWTADTTLIDGMLTVRITDRDGTPVDATITATGYPRAHADRTFDLQLPARIAHAHGLYDLHITATRGADRYTARVTTEAQ